MGGCSSRPSVQPFGQQQQHEASFSPMSSRANGHRGKGSSSGEVRGSSSGEAAAAAGAAAAAHGAAASPPAAAAAPTPSAVKVAVVVRPLLPDEAAAGAAPAVRVAAPSRVVVLPKSSGGAATAGDAAEFAFDRAYACDGAAAGRELYAEMVAPVVERLCNGYNATVLAYGQTGSGKTHTMGTAGGAAGGPSAQAVIPQACAQVLAHCARAQQKYNVRLHATFVEIYNEQLRDLLALDAMSAVGAAATGNGGGAAGGGADGGGNGTGIGSGGSFSSTGSGSGGSGGSSGVAIREAPGGEILLEGATEVLVRSAGDVAAVLARGNAVRATAAHRLNQSSSRSHAILTLTLEQRATGSAAATLPRELRLLRSKLHLVDLAGSERAKETGTSGQRFAEGVAINKGLLVLGTVINALSSGGGTGGNGGSPAVRPSYRESRLTRLLQDSLGGTAETLMIACVSPGDASRELTLGTLRYASRAMRISNRLARAAALTPEEELQLLRCQVAELQEENERLRRQLGEQQQQQQGGSSGGGGSGGAGATAGPPSPLSKLSAAAAVRVNVRAGM